MEIPFLWIHPAVVVLPCPPPLSTDTQHPGWEGSEFEIHGAGSTWFPQGILAGNPFRTCPCLFGPEVIYKHVF